MVGSGRLLKPMGVGAVPLDGFPQAVSQGDAGFPPQSSDFLPVQRITLVVARAICHVLYAIYWRIQDM